MISLVERIAQANNLDSKHPFYDQKNNYCDGAASIDKYNRKLSFKNNVPFSSCISKINNVLIDNTEGLDVVMSMYNLMEYSRV